MENKCTLRIISANDSLAAGIAGELRQLGFEAAHNQAEITEGRCVIQCICAASLDEMARVQVDYQESLLFRLSDQIIVDPALCPYQINWPVTTLTELKRMMTKIIDYRTGPWSKKRKEYLVGDSAVIKHIRKEIEKIAESDVTTLITGASGTGKERVANLIHIASDRKDGPFIAINCGAIPSELIESELFGHERGAFTGAHTRKIGKFEAANNGTLLLDEISELPINMQVKLLRVLQERSFERIGSNEKICFNVRIIAATNKNLEEQIINGLFREDLFYRINVVPIELPSLIDRIDDLPLLIEDINYELHIKYRKRVKISMEALEALMKYHWPGNIRELSNFLERMIVHHGDAVISPYDLPKNMTDFSVRHATNLGFDNNLQDGFSVQFCLKSYLENIEVDKIQVALGQVGGTVSKAAELLGIKRTTLIEKMKKYKITLNKQDFK